MQFELAYSDFRVIQLALQLDGQKDLLSKFTSQYNDIYKYEMAFVRGGMAEFDNQFEGQIDDYQKAEQSLLETLKEIRQTQPEDDAGNKLI
ncbi:hypothetical protein FD16_GL001219 [Paucilactobacillus suebicus DSM 5007 = KCTC 3549]|uniref:Uncharacterized protein n=1 Tax=Paucilactobacillus suebicus DSM 5007 = KCTC 3549 TaxID=1423807 RepID=A0A0R1VX60_9LACO|nr:hypothetical protein FD16_GL001219 [Paucilactobacillus suebicus DSM 5007 = KCTC 3549]